MTPRRIGDVSDDATLLAKGALLELFDLFPKLRPKCAVGGGIAVAEWIGRPGPLGALNTADVDLVLDIHVGEDYPLLRKTLLDTGRYEPRRDKRRPERTLKFSYWRKGPGNQRVQIDFLGPEHGGSRLGGGRERLQEIGDLSARVLIGGSLGLKYSEMRTIVGRTLEGEQREGDAMLVKPMVLVPLKAVAFARRGLKRGGPDEDLRAIKDAGDLYALLRFVTEGPAVLARGIKPHRGLGFVQDAMRAIDEHFTRASGEGVEAVVDFLSARVDEAIVRGEVVALATDYLRALRSRD